MAGRPKGSKSFKNQQWAKLGEYITDTAAKKLIAELSKLEGKEYIEAVGKLLAYFKPKLQNTVLETDNELTITIKE